MNLLFENKEPGKAGTHEWLTPPNVTQSLGDFDLDPCASKIRPWDTAKKHYTIDDDGLTKKWEGRVWCNPPYGKHSEKWIAKCVLHKNAMLLIFARTDTKVWHDMIFKRADAILFLSGRLNFYKTTGEKGGTAGAPSALIAFGANNVLSLKQCILKGKLIIL